MFRGYKIIKEQRAMQRILWRTDRNSPVKIYELNTITYGTASAPFLATRCLHELGLQNKERYPEASKGILHDFYVDDLLSGAQTFEAACQLKAEWTSILDSAGLELRKWASNDLRIIQDGNQKEHEDVPIHGEKDPKTLGLV
ncbi:uncharacterized protein LOC112494195 [Cephus cinctus]|uniref:Uncharacterized protein LOC112494195 n=1 Tax=Cephus cinctus TaxID=211228 RepID=A0AAJ7W0M3_CEPCN|nr:uncharacterized protein LOC112494195 [Cephus cinctus]